MKWSKLKNKGKKIKNIPAAILKTNFKYYYVGELNRHFELE